MNELKAAARPNDNLGRRQIKADLELKIRSERRAVLVVNTRSRRGARSYAEAKRLILEQGISLAGDYSVQDPARIPEIVARSVAQGLRLVIVGGGDGTISSVVDSFVYKQVVFGLLPLGTANSFARSLGIPLDLKAAVEVLANGKVTDVDLGHANRVYFANSLAIGLAAQIARESPDRLKWLLGRAGYLIAAAVKLASFKSFCCTVTAEGKAPQSFESVLEIRVANGPYTGGMLAAPEASLESRDLVLHIVKGSSRVTLARVWAMMAAGYAPSNSQFVTLRAPGFRVDTDPSQFVSIDGEPVTETPLEVGVARQALNILVPHKGQEIT